MRDCGDGRRVFARLPEGLLKSAVTNANNAFRGLSRPIASIEDQILVVWPHHWITEPGIRSLERDPSFVLSHLSVVQANHQPEEWLQVFQVDRRNLGGHPLIIELGRV